MLGLVIGTLVGTPEWVKSTCTTGTVLCGCMFPPGWIESTVCTTGTVVGDEGGVENRGVFCLIGCTNLSVQRKPYSSFG